MSEKAKRYEEITAKYGDPWIWGIYLTLVIVSLVESYSASSIEIVSQGVFKPVFKQFVFLLGGFSCIAILYRTNYNNKALLAVIIPLLWLVTVVTLIIALFKGAEVNGAQRAINLPGFTLQPAELAKLSAVTVLAFVMARNQINRDVSRTGMIISAVIVAVFGGLLIKSGLTNTVLLMAISVTMMLVGGASLKKIFFIFIAYALIGGGFYAIQQSNENKAKAMMEDAPAIEAQANQADSSDNRYMSRSNTWMARFDRYFNSVPLLEQSLSSENAQEMYSRIAQGHGGLTGVGIGNSRECSRLPLAFSDYIYSIIIEETGFVGALFILILYLWLLARAAMIARKCRRVLPALLIIGMASMIVYQALFHMAINVGVFPVSGQPLPLISKGGTSIFVTSVAFGIMLSVSRTVANQSYTNKENRDEQLPKGLDAENPTQIIKGNVWK